MADPRNPRNLPRPADSSGRRRHKLSPPDPLLGTRNRIRAEGCLDPRTCSRPLPRLSYKRQVDCLARIRLHSPNRTGDSWERQLFSRRRLEVCLGTLRQQHRREVCLGQQIQRNRNSRPEVCSGLPQQGSRNSRQGVCLGLPQPRSHSSSPTRLVVCWRLRKDKILGASSACSAANQGACTLEPPNGT